jgi:flagellar biosynthesis/type III secretory pathway chaperone
VSDRDCAAVLGRFASVLDDEYRALLEGDAANLTSVVEEKSALARALASMGRPPMGEALERLAREAASRNARNGRLIGERLANLQGRLSFFTQAQGASAPLYSRDGVGYSLPGRISTKI